jgi:predicted AlkP superfamily pyrophosphatase or phosphodiesterase
MKTFILFLDAFSSSDFNEENCPFLYKLAKEGAYGSTEIIPSCYHTEYSMFSGCLPTQHNVWTWFYRKEKSSFSRIKYIKFIADRLDKMQQTRNINRRIMDIYLTLWRMIEGKTRFLRTNRIPINFLPFFEIAVDKSYVDHNPLPVPTLFDVFRKEGIKYSAMDYPVISNNKRTFFYLGKKDFKQLMKMEKLLKKNSVVYAHIWDLDAIEHKYGLHSKEALEHIKKLDEKIKEIVSSYNGELRVIIFSDHGGCNVKKTKNILPIIKDYADKYFIGSTNAQVWLKDLSKKEELEKKLKEEDYLIYDEKNIEKELSIPYYRDYVGDFMIAVKPGEQLYPDFFRDTDKVESMHGYTKKTPEINGIFIANGFDSKTKNIKGMKLYDIMPTILGAMKIKIPEGCDGKSRI